MLGGWKRGVPAPSPPRPQHSPHEYTLHICAEPGCGPWEKEGRDWPESQFHKGRVTQGGQSHLRGVKEGEVLVGARAQEGRAVWGPFKPSGKGLSPGPDTLQLASWQLPSLLEASVSLPVKCG